MARHDGDGQGEDWFVEEWHRGIGWAAADDEHGQPPDRPHPGPRPPGGHPGPFAPKPGRGRLLAGFALGAATVLAVQYGPAVLTAAPAAVVTGTALPAAGAAAAPAAPSPPPAATTPAAPAAQTPSPSSP
ncbi:MAG TPA: hypothetical protein VFH84_39285, partial [Amycolatopsis sp.]|nr:hypothetical protein [Amycolatopsis sp.]